MRWAIVLAATSGCMFGADVRLGARPTGKSPEVEAAASFVAGGVVKRDGRRLVSLAATLDTAGYVGHPHGVASGGLMAQLEQRRPLGFNNRRFAMWLVQLHGGLGAELRDDDEGSILPSARVLVGYGRGWNVHARNRSASWHVGLTVSRASLDERGGAWFIGIGAGLRGGFWLDALDEDTR